MDVVREGLKFCSEHWVISTILALSFLLFYHYQSSFTSIKRLGIKGPTPWPIIGNSMPLIMGKPLQEFFEGLYKKYGKVCGFYFLRSPSILVSDPEILKNLFVKDFEKFHDQNDVGLTFPPPFDSMLIGLTGSLWKSIRSVLTPTFTSGKLKQMLFIMSEATDTLLGKLDKVADTQKAIDIYEWQRGVTMEVILSSSFGVKTESQTNPNDKMTRLAKGLMEGKPWPEIALMIPVIGKYLSTKLNATARFGFGNSPIVEIAKKIIKQRKESINNGEKRNDVLTLMLETQSEDSKGHKLTDEEIIAQMVMFILAGYDTSSTTLGLTCYNLAVFPEVQEKLVEEIKQVCASEDSVTYDEIQKMPYLEACISETMRLYPPGFLTSRTVTQSCNINGVHFEKGMAVFIPIYSLHHDEQYWDDPEAFKPERFLPENKESITPYTYLPFGSGPRGCIGMRFAWMEMKMVVVRMMQEYRLVRGPETSVPIKMAPREVFSPSEPVLVRVEKRK